MWIDLSYVGMAFQNTLLKEIKKGCSSEGKTRKILKQLLHNCVKTRVYWKLNGESLDSSLWITRFGSVYLLVGRQTTDK